MTEQGGAGGSTPVQQQQQQSTATAVTSNPSSPTTASAPPSIPSTQHAGSASLASLHTVRASKAYQRYAGEFDRLLTLLLRTPQADWAAQSAVLTQLLHHLDAARDVVGVAALPNALLFDQALARGLHVQNPLGVQRKALEVLVRYMTCLAASPWEQQHQQQQEQQTRLAATKASPSSSTGGAYTSPLHMDYPHLVLAVLELLPQSSMQLKGELMSFVERYVVDVLPPRLLRSCIYGILAAVLHCLEEAEASASYRQATRLLRNLQRRVSHDTSGCTMTSSTLTRSPPCTEACTGAAAFFATLWSLVRDCDALRAPALLYLRLSIAQLRLANDGSHARPAAARSTDNSFAVQNNNNSAAAAAAVEIVTPVSSSPPQPPASMSPSGNAEPHTRPNSPFVSAVSHTQPTSLERNNNNNNNSNEEDDTWLGGAENRQLVLAALLTALQDRRERVQRLVLDLLIAYVPLSSSEARAGTMSGAASADHAGTMQGAAQVVHAPFSFASQTLLMTAAVQLVGLPGAKPAAGVLRRVVAWLCGPVSSLPSSSSAGGSDYIAHSSGYVLSQAFYGIVHWWEQTCLPAALGQSTGDTEVVVGISNSSSHNTGSSLPLTHAASTMSETTQNEAECAATLYVVLQQSAVSALAQGVGSSSSSSYRARDMQEYILPELALPYVWLSALVSLLHYSVTLDEDEAERAGALASPTMVHEVLATPATMSVQQGSSTNNNLMSSSSSGGEDAAGTRMATPLEQPVQGSETSAGEQAYPVLTAALPLLLPTLSHLLVCIQDLSSCSSSSSSSTGVPAMMEALLRRVFDIVPWQTFMQYNAGQVALLRGAIGPLLTQLQSLRAAAEDDEEEKKKRDVAQQDGNNTHAPSLLVPAEQLAEAAAAAAATNNNNIGGSSSDLHSPWRVLHAQVTQCVRQLRCTAQLLERHVVVQAQERPGQAAQLYSEVNTLVVQLAEVLQTLCEGLAGMSHVPALRAAHGSLPCVILRTFMQGTQALLHEYYLVLRAGLYAQLRLGLQATTTTIVNDREDVTLPVLQAMTKASLSLLSLLRTHTAAMHTEACTAGRNVEWMTSVCSQLQRTIVSAITQATQLTRRAADSTSSSSPPDNKSERNTLGRVVQDWLTAQLALLEGDTLCTCLVWPMCEVMLDLTEAATPVPAEVALLLREQSTVTLRPLLHKLWAMLGHRSGSEEERSYRCERAVDLLLRAHDMAACRPTLDQFMACPAASVQGTREAELYTTCVRIAHLFLSVLHRHKTSEQQQRLRSGTKNNIAVALPQPVVGCMFFTGYCTLLRYMGATHTPLTTQYDTMHRSCPVEQLWAELAKGPSQLLQPWLEAFLAASQGIIIAASQQQQQYTSDSSSGGESSARQVAVCAEDSSASSSSSVIAYRPVEVRELMSYMHTMLSCRTLSVERWVRRCAVEDDLPDTLRIQLTALELPLSTRINSARQETNISSTNNSRNAKTSSSSSSYAAAQTLRVTTWLGAVVKVLLGVFVQSLLLLPPQPRSTSSEADTSRTSASRENGEHVQTALAAMHCVNLFLQHSLHEAAPTEAAIRIWRYSASQSVAWLQYSLTVRLPPVQAALATHIACAVQLLAGTRCDARATYSSDLHQLPVLGPTHLQLIVDNKQQQQQRQPRTARSTNALTSGSSNSAAGNDEEGEDSDANGSAAGCTSVAAALRRSAPAVLALPALYQVLHAALAQPGAGGDNGCIIAQWSAFVQQLLPFLFRELRPATERIYNAFLHLLERTIAEAGTARQATGHVRCSSEASLAVQSACYDALTDIMSYLVLLAHAAEAEQQRRAAQKARESAGWLSSAFASNNSNSNNNTNAAAAAIQTTGQVFVRESRWSNSALLASTRAVLPRIIHCALYSLTLTTAGTTRVHPGRVAALRASLTRLLRLLHRAGDGTWYVCYMTQWANMHAGHIAAALLSTQPARLQDFSLAALATVDALLSLGSASWEEVMQALLYLSTGVRGTCGQDDTDGEGKRGSRSAMRALLAATAHTSPRHTTSTKEGASHSSLHESETTPSLSAETRCVVLLDALLQARTASHDGGKDDCVVPPPCKVRRMGRSELAASLALLAELLRPGSAPSAATLTLVLHVLAGLRVAQVIHTRRADMRSTSTSGSNNNTTTSEEEDLFSDKRYATLLTRVLEVLSGAPVHLLNNAEGNNTATMVVTLRVLQKLLPSLLPRASLAAMSGADSSRIANAAVAFVNRALLPTLLYGVQSLRASDIVARTPLMVTCLHLLRALLAVGVVGTPSSSSSLSSSSAVAATISGTNAPSSQPPAAMSTTEWPVLRALRSECVNYLVSERFFCYAPEALRAWLEVWRVLGSDKPLRVLLTDKLAGGTSRLSAIITSAESEANQRARQLRCLAFYTLALSSPQANDREFVHYVRDQLNDALARYSGTLPLPTVEQLGSRAVWLAPMSAVMMLFRVLLLKLYDVTLQNMCALLMPELMRGLMLAASVMPSAKEGGARGKEAMSPAVRAELTDFVMECLKVLDTALLVCPQAMASYRGIFFPDCATQTQGVAMGNDSKRGHDGGESRSFTPLLVPLVQGSTTGANSAPCEDDRDGMAMPHNDCVSRTHACPAPCDAQAAQWLPLVCYGDGRRNEDEEEAAAASRSTSTHGCGAPRPVLRLARVQYEQRPDCVVQSASALLRQARLWQTNELSCNEQRRTTGYDAQDVVWRLLADMTLVDTHPML